MNFREYRRKETIRAAEITEDKMLLRSALEEDDLREHATETGLVDYGKGDYAELRDGVLFGYTKGEFDSRFASVRAPRQSKQVKQKRRNERVTPAPELATK